MLRMDDFFTDINWDRWSETAWTHGVRILIVVVAIYLALRILGRVIGPGVRAAVAARREGEPDAEAEKRIETLSHVIYRTVVFIGVFIGLLTILPEFGINIGALLAGAGIIGLAIGFGAQSLVRDVISGLFVLIENQYGKGDVVHIAGVEGLVEDVNLRRTILRDLDGTVHSVPNGSILVSSNMTRAWSRVNLVASVAYDEELSRVFAAIDRVGDDLARDPSWSGDIIKAPRALGVEQFSDVGVQVRVLGDAQPGRQWDVMRELRLRLKRAFDADGIRAGA